VVPGPSAPPPTLRDQLQGTWRLVSHERRDNANDAWTRRYGDHPRGYIMYDATGHMMVGFEKMPPPPKFASGDDWTPTPDEARVALLGYASYFGTYTVDEAAHAVTHHVEGGLAPSYFGTEQLRPATLDGDRLTLSDGTTFRVVWERVR
jgi:hypothetical protein